MKITIERAALLKAISRVHRAVEQRNTIPILGNVLISAQGDRLWLRATDLDIEISQCVTAAIIQPGATTVPAILLYNIVSKLPDGAQIGMELIKDGASVALRAGKSKFTLRTLPDKDFPDLSVGEITHRFTVSSTDLGRLIGKSQFAIANDASRYYLCGIYLHAVMSGNRLMMRAVATDGHRLAQVEVAAPDGADGMPGVIIPRKTVEEARRLADGNAELAVELSQTKIRFIVDDATLTSKLVDGTYPDYDRVVPRNNDKVAEFNRHELERLVDRVSTVAGNDRNMKFSLTAGRLEASAKNTDTAALAVDDIDAGYEGDPIETAFNSRYLTDIIGRMDGSTAVLKLGDPGSPALFCDKDAGDALYVLMPMRVS